MKHELQRRKDIRRGVASVIVITGYLRTGDSDFTIELHQRSRPHKQLHRAMTAHANRWSHAPTTDNSDFDDEPHKGNMQDLRRPCPKEHLGHAGKIRLPKPEPRPKLLLCHHRCQTEIGAPETAASANHAAKMPPFHAAKMPPSHAAKMPPFHAAKMPPSTGLRL